MVHLISYDLIGHERPKAYAAVKDVIERNALSHRRPLFSDWFVDTDKTPEQWYGLLAPALDENDRVFISEMKRSYWGRLGGDSEIFEWLRARV